MPCEMSRPLLFRQMFSTQELTGGGSFPCIFFMSELICLGESTVTFALRVGRLQTQRALQGVLREEAEGGGQA